MIPVNQAALGINYAIDDGKSGCTRLDENFVQCGKPWVAWREAYVSGGRAYLCADHLDEHERERQRVWQEYGVKRDEGML